MPGYNDMYAQLTGIPVGPPTQGKTFFVRPYDGADGNCGLGTSSHKALKSLSRAHTLATADRNDTIYLLSQSNTAASTTDFLSSGLTISKDGIRIIGVNSGSRFSQRSRIAPLSTATAFSPMVTISCCNGHFENLQFINERDSATQAINVHITGDRNTFVNCHFAGTVYDSQDVATACDVKFEGAKENVFIDCTFGIDTTKRGTAQVYGMLFAAGTTENTRNYFYGCHWLAWAEAAGYVFMKTEAGSLDRITYFENCKFINHPTGSHTSATTLTECFDISGTGNGELLFDPLSGFMGAPCWEADAESGKLWVLGTTPTNAAGVAILAESP